MVLPRILVCVGLVNLHLFFTRLSAGAERPGREGQALGANEFALSPVLLYPE